MLYEVSASEVRPLPAGCVAEYAELTNRTIKRVEFSNDKATFIITLSDDTVYSVCHAQEDIEVVSFRHISYDYRNTLCGARLDSVSLHICPVNTPVRGTWSCLYLNTNKGQVMAHWYGTGDGTSSESVDLYRLK